MATADDIHRELFDRVNKLEQAQSEVNGYLKAVVAQNERYIALVWRVILILAFITVASLFALIYGAIGKEGLHSVRDTMPSMPQTAECMPWVNDFDRKFFLRESWIASV